MDACQECGLRLPMLEWNEWWRGGTPMRHHLQRPRHYFARCPACGGAVAYAPFTEDQRQAHARYEAKYGETI